MSRFRFLANSRCGSDEWPHGGFFFFFFVAHAKWKAQSIVAQSNRTRSYARKQRRRFFYTEDARTTCSRNYYYCKTMENSDVSDRAKPLLPSARSPEIWQENGNRDRSDRTINKHEIYTYNTYVYIIIHIQTNERAHYAYNNANKRIIKKKKCILNCIYFIV